MRLRSRDLVAVGGNMSKQMNVVLALLVTCAMGFGLSGCSKSVSARAAAVQKQVCACETVKCIKKLSPQVKAITKAMKKARGDEKKKAAKHMLKAAGCSMKVGLKALRKARKK